MSATPADVTLVKGAIHNPADARHFMRIAEPAYEVTASLDGLELARSRRALKLKEVGYDVYDPVIYFPREDVDMSRLEKTGKTTHCPLKGDTEYFDGVTDAGRVAELAWSYDRTLDFAAQIEGYVAFDSRKVTVVEHTAGG
ncbi:MAG: DUF427 domain-containing protein [Gammaproteobacteria bacterium]